MQKFFNLQKMLELAALGAAIACIGGSLSVAKARTSEMNVFSTDGLKASPSVSRFPKQIAPDLFTIAANIPETENLQRFTGVVEYARSRQLYDRPMGEIVQAIAEQFLGTPYAAGLLDKSQEEKLIISLDGFDCVLFVETVLAIARGVAVQDYTYPTFAKNIVDQRYRHGQLDGYCSRLHYFSDWIYDNQNRGNVANITQTLGGIPLGKTLNFMSQHRASYPQMASDEANYQCIRSVEANLEKLRFEYIPKNRIYTLYNRLQPGDIIATTADIEGLDVTHTGFIYRQPDGGMGFIHASPSGEVKISRDLQSYVENVEGLTGIIVARPTDPRQMGRQQ